MKGATDLLFTKATYYKKRKGFGSPRWRFTTYPPVLLTELFSEKYQQIDIFKNISGRDLTHFDESKSESENATDRRTNGVASRNPP